jgi:hypothetical protein
MLASIVCVNSTLAATLRCHNVHLCFNRQYYNAAAACVYLVPIVINVLPRYTACFYQKAIILDMII